MTHAVYIRYANINGRYHDCILDVTDGDNLTTPEIKDHARDLAKRLFGTAIHIVQVKILH